MSAYIILHAIQEREKEAKDPNYKGTGCILFVLALCSAIIYLII